MYDCGRTSITEEKQERKKEPSSSISALEAVSPPWLLSSSSSFVGYLNVFRRRAAAIWIGSAG